ncbi:hypothetical protein [Pseudomonas syringae]|uniref:hypothetical protein n=1 Tax=Pseudomonas syringae TaxID=317 RepID=UPI001BD100D3|nr:hypothetical protein [Pseudomonas syringae]MBS7459208.1 hypothetical protein [Pseudomonas syringae]
MKTSKPQISLAVLAQAVEAHDGIVLASESEEGRKRLLEIAAALLENPVKNRALLALISKLSRPNSKPPEPWPYKGKVRYVETAEPIHEHAFLFDDIDHLRLTDALGRSLKKASGSVDNVTITSTGTGAKEPASPSQLGFENIAPRRTFNRKAFHAALTSAHKELSSAARSLADVVVISEAIKDAPATSKLRSEAKSAAIRSARNELTHYVVNKDVVAPNFHKWTIHHARRDICVAYIGSGNDLFLTVTIDNNEIVKAKESLINSDHLSSVFSETLASDPKTGVVILSSMLDELAFSAEPNTYEPQ